MKFKLIAVVTLACIILSGCKIEIKVPEGGAVVSESGAFTCEPGTTCTVDVVDLFFDETFSGEPEPGYVFDQWEKLEGGSLCGGSAAPCRLFTSWMEQFPGLIAILESDQVFHLRPVFTADPAVLSNCTGPDGTIIDHGGSQTYFLASSVPAGSSCVGELRTCNDGSLSGSNTFADCTVEQSTVLRGEERYRSLCQSCHGASGQGGAAPRLRNCNSCSSLSTLTNRIQNTMPQNAPSSCVGDCAAEIAEYILAEFN